MKKLKSNRILLYLGIGVVVLVIILVIGSKQGWFGNRDSTRVSIEKAKLRTLLETVSASGKIYPQVEVKISSDVSGEIVHLLVEEGDSVKEGDLLANVKPDIYQSIVERAEASLNSSKANLANAKARLSQAEARKLNATASFNRNKQLYSQKVISIADFETAETNFKTNEAEHEAAVQTVNGAEYAVKSTAAALKEARDNLEKTTIYAPMTGVVSMLNVEEGERVVGTEMMAGTELMRVANLNNMEVRVDVSENDILKLTIGDTATIEVDAYLNREFKGVVTEIAHSARMDNQITSDQVTNFVVKIRLLNESFADLLEGKAPGRFPFKSGMSATVSVLTERAREVLTIPLISVTTREEEDDSAKTDKDIREVVFVHLKDSHKVKAVDVSTGIQDDTHIHIISGLKQNDAVVTGPFLAISKKLKNGDPVKVVKREELFRED